jgi:hypothetical protein
MHITDIEWGFAAQVAPAFAANGWVPSASKRGHALVRSIAETAAHLRESALDGVDFDSEPDGLSSFASTMHIKVEVNRYLDEPATVDYLLDVSTEYEPRSLG